MNLFREEQDASAFTVGNTYQNRHNGRVIEIDDKEITDTGLVLWTGTEVGTTKTLWLTGSNRKHWNLTYDPSLRSVGQSTKIAFNRKQEEE